MITEDYVSFETAKLLKEKGFSENTICKYADVGGVTEKWYDDYRERVVRFNWEEGYLIKPLSEPKDQYEITGDTILAPTIQMAMKWLREVHKLGVFPTTFYREMGNNVKHDYGSTIVRLDTFEIIGNKNVEDYTFAADTYEGTTEKAIKYCLENLI